MNVYYQPAVVAGTTDRHALTVRVWAADVPAFDETVLAAGVLLTLVDEIKANRADLSALSRPAAPGEPDWLLIDGGSYQRPDGSVWVPVINNDKNTLLTKADADEARLNEIRNLDNTATLNDVRRACNDLAAILERVHRHVVRMVEDAG